MTERKHKQALVLCDRHLYEEPGGISSFEVPGVSPRPRRLTHTAHLATAMLVQISALQATRLHRNWSRLVLAPFTGSGAKNYLLALFAAACVSPSMTDVWLARALPLASLKAPVTSQRLLTVVF